jgi:hypothetical protein
MSPACGRASKDARQQRCSLIRETPDWLVRACRSRITSRQTFCDVTARLISRTLSHLLLVLGISSRAGGSTPVAAIWERTDICRTLHSEK